MIILKDDVPVKTVTGLHGGEGRLISRNFLDLEKSLGAGRVFSVSTLEEGASVAWHIHSGDSETFYVLKGAARVADGDGSLHILNPGDVAFCPDGEGHSIEAEGGPVEYISIILFTKQQEV